MTDAAVDAGMARPLLTAAGAIIVLTGAAYCNALTGVFLFDDYHQILMNPHIRRLADIPGLFTSGSGSSLYTDLKGYRPLTMSSFALNYAVSGYNVWSYHLFNLLLHIINAFMVYLIASRLIGGAALPASLLFALHPIQTNAVTYISGRSAILPAFFCLTGILLFMRYRAAGPLSSRMGLGISALAAFALGLLSKETAVVMIGLMLAYDIVYTVPARGGAGKALKEAWIYLPFLAVLAAYLVTRKAAMGYVAGVETGYGRWEYLVSEAKVLLMYVRLLLLPTNQNADYALPLAGSLDVKAVIGFGLVAAALYLLLRVRRERPALAFFGLWFFVAWAPESTFVPITDLAVEYRMYMPSAGFIAFMAALTGTAVKLPSVRKWAAVAAVLLLAVLCFNRNLVWATERSLWEDAGRKAPNSTRPYLNLQMALVHEKKYAEAAAMESVLLRPGVAMSGKERAFVLNHTGFALMMMGNPAEAMGRFEQAAREDPGLYDSYENMGLALMAMGRNMEASAAFRKAIEIVPGFADAHTNLSLALGMMKMDTQALAEAREAVRLEPRDFECNYNLAIALYNIGRRADAYEQALVTEGLAGGPKERAKAEALLSSVRR